MNYRDFHKNKEKISLTGWRRNIEEWMLNRDVVGRDELLSGLFKDQELNKIVKEINRNK